MRSILRPGRTGDSALFVHESGNPGSPVVLILHGAGAGGRMWRTHMERLSDRFHCLAPDLPGFGRSHDVPPLPAKRIRETPALEAEMRLRREAAGAPAYGRHRLAARPRH